MASKKFLLLDLYSHFVFIDSLCVFPSFMLFFIYLCSLFLFLNFFEIAYNSLFFYAPCFSCRSSEKSFELLRRSSFFVIVNLQRTKFWYILFIYFTKNCFCKDKCTQNACFSKSWFFTGATRGQWLTWIRKVIFFTFREF